MHAAHLTALSRAVSFVSALPLVGGPELSVLLGLRAVPLSDDAFAPQPAPISPIRQASPSATNGRRFIATPPSAAASPAPTPPSAATTAAAAVSPAPTTASAATTAAAATSPAPTPTSSIRCRWLRQGCTNR